MEKRTLSNEGLTMLQVGGTFLYFLDRVIKAPLLTQCQTCFYATSQEVSVTNTSTNKKFMINRTWMRVPVTAEDVEALRDEHSNSQVI